MKKKGFTLVELLAVIVILAVILTIAVPAVKKTIDNAKKKSAENDAIMIKNIAEKYYTSNLDKDEEITGIDLSTDTLSYSGKKPFNPEEKDCQEKLNKWKEKAKTSKFY